MKLPPAFCVVLSVIILTLVGTTSALAQGETGDLKITFKYLGDLPAAKQLQVTQDKEFCLRNGPILDESLLVHKENKGVKNVIVYAYTSRRGGMKLPAFPPVNQEHVIANQQCRFEPRVTLIRAGDTIEITNPDAVGHNAKADLLGNPPFNVLIPPGTSTKVALAAPGLTIDTISCSIHPWMNCYVMSVAHPFIAVTDENGELEIKGLPVGDVTLRAWHERGTFTKKIFINSEQTKWSKNILKYDLKAGQNDLGIVEVPADQFN